MARADTELRYKATSLKTFAGKLLSAAGLEADKSTVVAEILVRGDMMNHTTHGLTLLAGYLVEIEAGDITREGDYGIVSDFKSVQVWEGRNLPGPWLVVQAMASAIARAREFGQGCVVIRNCHHIASLGAYLIDATDQNTMAVITCSDPASASVAPFGGRDRVFTPNPIGVGLPTRGEPILIDMSASITTNARSKRLADDGELFPGLWAIDGDGQPSDDPSKLFGDTPGALLPAGGLDHGHKGYGIALLIEGLTQGLGGYGRADAPVGRASSVFVQIFNPDAFGGTQEFKRQTQWLAEACRQSKPIDNSRPVRLPGDNACLAFRESERDGVRLAPGIIDTLRLWAVKYRISLPSSDTL